ncbi:MAG TPA: BON domain-containing protein [Puia sp.]|nr:BON domain-containing protein [Puia sp.]
MQPDISIQKDIISRLQDAPFINSAAIGVAVIDGVAALSGQAASMEQKKSAEETVSETIGVRAVATEIRVGAFSGSHQPDWDLAGEVADALAWHTIFHDHLIRIRVEDGTVSLEGIAEFVFQKYAALEAVRSIVGEARVLDRIRLKTPLTSTEADRLVKTALAVHPSLDCSMFKVEIENDKAILSGVVYSAVEKSEVGAAAGNLTGVTAVDNRLTLIKEQQTLNIPL